MTKTLQTILHAEMLIIKRQTYYMVFLFTDIKIISINKLTTMFTLLVTTNPNVQFQINDPGLRKDTKAKPHIRNTICNAAKYIEIAHIRAVTTHETASIVLGEIVDALESLRDEKTILTTCIEARKNVGASQCQVCAFSTGAEGLDERPIIMIDAYREYTEAMFYSFAGTYKPDKDYIVCQRLHNAISTDKSIDVAFIYATHENKVHSIQAKRNVKRTYYAEEILNTTYASVNMVCFQPSLIKNANTFLKEIPFKHTDMTLYAFMLREVQRCHTFYMVKVRPQENGRSGTPSTVVSDESVIDDDIFNV